MAPRRKSTHKVVSLHPYLHQEDIVPLGCSDKVFHLFGVHSKRFLTQHVLPGLEEHQTDFPVLCVQHPQVHDVCRDTDASGLASNHNFNAIFSACVSRLLVALTNVWVVGQLLIAAISCRNTMLLGEVFGTLQVP